MKKDKDFDINDISVEELVNQVSQTTNVKSVDVNELNKFENGEVQTNLFKEYEIRKILHDDEWFYSIIDVVGAITESENSRDYWYRLKSRMDNEENAQLSTICRQLKLPAKDGKIRVTDCSNIEGLFRIIQSVPSPNAEPFKKWLAKTGYERILENQNPSIAIKRAVAEYRMQGRDEKWIKERLSSISTRNQLTAEWKDRGIKEGGEYGILTNAISQGTFGIKTKEHKDLKALKKHDSLRDHMASLELILTMLGEETTRQIAINIDAQGFDDNLMSANEGGKIAGQTRANIEKQTGKSVISKANFLSKKDDKDLV